MGNNSSQSFESYVRNQTDLTSSVSATVKATSTVQTATYTSGTASLNVGNPSVCCTPGDDACVKLLAKFPPKVECKNLEVSVKSDVKIQVASNNFSQLSSQLTDKVSEQLQNKVSQEMEQTNKNGFIPSLPGGDQNQDVKTTIINSLKKSVKVALSEQSLSTLSTSSGQRGDATFNLCFGKLEGAKNCTVSSSFSIDLFITNVNSAVQNAIISNETARSVFNSTKAHGTQLQTNFISSFFDNLSGMEMAIMAVVGLMILAVAAWFIFGGSSSASTVGSVGSPDGESALEGLKSLGASAFEGSSATELLELAALTAV